MDFCTKSLILTKIFHSRGKSGRLCGVEQRTMSIIDALLSSPIFWGVIALVLAAIALSGKFSVNAAKVLLVCAGCAAIYGVYRSGVALRLAPIPRYLFL